MIAYQTGGKIHWDPERERIVEPEPAAGHLKREYRPPWKHPFED
jgi:hypothetical protein